MHISRFIGRASLRTRELRSSELAVLREAVRPIVANRKLMEADDEPSGLLRGAIIASLISSAIWGSVIVAFVWIWPFRG